MVICIIITAFALICTGCTSRRDSDANTDTLRDFFSNIPQQLEYTSTTIEVLSEGFFSVTIAASYVPRSGNDGDYASEVTIPLIITTALPNYFNPDETSAARVSLNAVRPRGADWILLATALPTNEAAETHASSTNTGEISAGRRQTVSIRFSLYFANASGSIPFRIPVASDVAILPVRFVLPDRWSFTRLRVKTDASEVMAVELPKVEQENLPTAVAQLTPNPTLIWDLEGVHYMRPSVFDLISRNSPLIIALVSLTILSIYILLISLRRDIRALNQSRYLRFRIDNLDSRVRAIPTLVSKKERLEALRNEVDLLRSEASASDFGQHLKHLAEVERKLTILESYPQRAAYIERPGMPPDLPSFTRYNRDRLSVYPRSICGALILFTLLCVLTWLVFTFGAAAADGLSTSIVLAELSIDNAIDTESDEMNKLYIRFVPLSLSKPRSTMEVVLSVAPENDEGGTLTCESNDNGIFAKYVDGKIHITGTAPSKQMPELSNLFLFKSGELAPDSTYFQVIGRTKEVVISCKGQSRMFRHRTLTEGGSVHRFPFDDFIIDMRVAAKGAAMIVSRISWPDVYHGNVAGESQGDIKKSDNTLQFGGASRNRYLVRPEGPIQVNAELRRSFASKALYSWGLLLMGVVLGLIGGVAAKLREALWTRAGAFAGIATGSFFVWKSVVEAKGLPSLIKGDSSSNVFEIFLLCALIVAGAVMFWVARPRSRGARPWRPRHSRGNW